MATLDIYSTRAQLAAIETLPRQYRFLTDVFAEDAGAVEDDRAIYDYRKGENLMAPVVTDDAGGVIMPRPGFSTREIGFCTVAPERLIDFNELKTRTFGENIIGGLTPEQRAKKLLARDQMELINAIEQRIAWMVRQVLLEGKLSVFRYTNEGRDLKTTLVADYGFTNTYAPETTWDQTGAKVDEDMRTIYDLVYDGGGAVEMIVMAPDVWSALQQNETFMKGFDYRRADMGNIDTKYMGQGVRFLGYNSDGVELYTFSGSFINDEGEKENYLPAGKLIAASKGVLNTFYGPVTQIDREGGDPTTYIKKIVPLKISEVGGTSIKLRMTSRPTVVPKNVDGWAVATVL